MNGQNGSVAGWSFQRILAWISANERARRRAAKRALRKAPPPRSRRVLAWLGSAVLAGAIGLSGVGTAQAATYNVGPGQTYTNLNLLRASGVLQSGDTVSLYSNDNSLMQQFAVTSASHMALTFRSNDTTGRSITLPSGWFTFLHIDAPTATLLMENITVQDCNSPFVGGGGAIYTTGSFTLGDNTTFNNNTTLWQNGGAINIQGVGVFGNNNTFTNNYAGNQGGAIYVQNSQSSNIGVSIGDNSMFTGNTANVWGGGAIFANYGDIVVGDVATFLGNRANGSGNGGAINAHGAGWSDQANVIIGMDSIFGGLGAGEGNTASHHGGAIYANGTATIGARANFTNNASTAGNGGAINVYAPNAGGNTSLLFLGDATFTGNTALKGSDDSVGYSWAYGSGGGVYAAYGNVVFDNNGVVTFMNNTAGMNGGAIAAWSGGWHPDAGNVTMGDNATFTGNTAGTATYGGNGGAIYAYSDVIIGNGLVLSGNKTLFAPWEMITVDHPKQLLLLPTGNGGGIFSYDGKIVVGDNATMNGNSAARRGGAIYAAGYAGQAWNPDYRAATSVYIGDDLTAMNNVSEQSYGGAIYTEFNAYIGENAKFIDNTALHLPVVPNDAPDGASLYDYGNIGRGGAIFSHRGNVVTGDGLTLTGNRAAGHGGAIITWGQDTYEGLWTGGGNIVIGKNATIQDNHSLYGSGGAIHAQFGDIAIGDGAQITGNTAGLDPDQPLELSIYGDGGAMYGSNVYIGKNVLFEENEAKQRGGAIYAGNHAVVDAGTVFNNNKALYAGGAILSQSKDAWVYINATIDPNTGRIDMNDGSADKVVFTGNTAEGADIGATNWGDGGAINVHDGSFNIVHTSFDDNKATGVGSANPNDTVGHGGAISMGHLGYWDSNTGEWIDESTGIGIIGNGVTFNANLAASNGGAIAAYGRGTSGYPGQSLPVLLAVTGWGIEFTGNKAGEQGTSGYGGAIYGEGSGSVVIGGKDQTYNVLFDGNSATQSGGAISVDANLFVGDGVVFQNNHAGVWGSDPIRGRGGAIHMNDQVHFPGDIHTLTMQVLHTDSYFLNNTAVMYVPFYDINGVETPPQLRLIYNDITLDGNAVADMQVAAGRTLWFNGGVVVNYDPDQLNPSSNAANWNMWGGGTIRLGGYFMDNNGLQFSRSFADGTTTLHEDTTLYLEYGAQFGYERVGNSQSGQNGRHVGEFVTKAGSTIAMEVDPLMASVARINQYSQAITEVQIANGHSWVHGAEIRIDDETDFVLDGVIWQPRTIYNLAETTLLKENGEAIRLRDYADLSPDDALAAIKADAVKTMFVTTGLDRGGFETNTLVTDLYNQPELSGYYFRDFVYYSGIGTVGAMVDDARILTDSNNLVVREFGDFNDADMKGNIYAVELYRKDTVEGGENPFWNPSLINRILARRLVRPCCPVCEDDNCMLECCLTDKGATSNVYGWIEGYGSATGGRPQFQTSPDQFGYGFGGTMFGIEVRDNEWNILGGYYGIGYSRMNSLIWDDVGAGMFTLDRGMNTRGYEHSFGLYSRMNDGYGYLFGAGSLGVNPYEQTRSVYGATRREQFDADYSAFTSNLYLEKGAEFAVRQGKCVNPFGGLQYAYLGTGSFNETAAATSMDLAQSDVTIRWHSLRSLLGTRAQILATRRFQWHSSVHWEHELLSPIAPVKRGTVMGTEFEAVGPTLGRDWFVLGTGVQSQLTKALSVNLNYDLYTNSHITLHTGAGGFEWNF